MKNKAEMRKQLEADMAIFLSQGKEITKCKTLKPHQKTSYKPKEKVVEVEIEVDALPESLKNKYFAE